MSRQQAYHSSPITTTTSTTPILHNQDNIINTNNNTLPSIRTRTSTTTTTTTQQQQQENHFSSPHRGSSSHSHSQLDIGTGVGLLSPRTNIILPRPSSSSSSSTTFYQQHPLHSPLKEDHHQYKSRIPSIFIPPTGPLPLLRRASDTNSHALSAPARAINSPYEQPTLPPLSAGPSRTSTNTRLLPPSLSSSSRSYSYSYSQNPHPSQPRLSPFESPHTPHFPNHNHNYNYQYGFPLSASSSSSQGLGDRGLRSPHPPLTASLHSSQHSHLWPPALPPIHQLHSHSHSLSYSHSHSPLNDPAHTRSYYTTPHDLPSVPGPSQTQFPITSSSASISYPSAPPFLPPPNNYSRTSPLHIPPPLRFKYSATPPDMPPRKKSAAAGANTSIAATTSTPRTVSSTTNAGSGSRGRKTANGKGWTMEHTYDSVGQKKEVIVINDSASPLVQPDIPRKRTRAQVAAEQALYNSTASVALSNGHGGSASVTGSAKKRKVDAAETGSAKKPKGKLASTATSSSVQTTGTGTWPQTQAAVQTKPSQWLKPAPPAPAPGQSSQPVWDDAEGHYIVKPDDVIGGRYKIVRLLGQGTFGKVVEARHIETRQKVAIKVIRAVQKYRDASKIEIRVLETLKRYDPRNDNKCIHLTEYFDFRNHPCLVSELYGMSVFDFLKQNSFQPFPEKHIQDFARSLLKSVAFLHSLKLVHTDLKPENILLCSNEARLQGPRVRNAKSKQILRNTEIRLIDFGSATFESEYHSSVVSTRHYRAPEIILGLPWSYPCDLFSIGCILVEFYTGDALFQTHDNLEHLAMMEVVMGKFSQRMLEKGRTKKPEFFKGNKIDFPNTTVSKSSRKYVKSMKTLKDIISPTTRHGNLFLDLCVRLLEADPDVRIKIQDALRHPYLAEPIPEPA